MSSTDLYLGAWELVPELSLYEFGPLPSSCTYEILERDGGLHVSMRWRLSGDGPESRMEFAGPSDGTRQPLEEGGPAGGDPITFSLTRVDSLTLESRAFRGEQVIAFARRAASRDGGSLAIVQEGQRPDGGRFRNFQLYRRRDAAIPARPRTDRPDGRAARGGSGT